MKKHNNKSNEHLEEMNKINNGADSLTPEDTGMPSDPDVPADPDMPASEAAVTPSEPEEADIPEETVEDLPEEGSAADDPDLPVETTFMDEIAEYTEPVADIEPVPMELGAHEIHTLVNDDDPDAPAFTEISTRPSEAKVSSSGKKMNWKPKMFLIVMAVVAILVLIWSVISLGNLNERMTSPLTVGSHDVSNAEFSFMYHPSPRPACHKGSNYPEHIPSFSYQRIRPDRC